MNYSKIALQVGVLSIYIFFPAYRYYALGAMLAHGLSVAIKNHKKLAAQKKSQEA